MRLRHVPVRKLRFVERPPRQEEWRGIHRAAEAGVRDAEQAFLAAIRALDRATRSAPIRGAVGRDAPEIAASAIPWDVFRHALEAKLLPVLMDVTRAGARVTVRSLASQLDQRLVLRKQHGEIAAAFDLANPKTAAAIARHGAELVTEITEETRLAIREVALAAQQFGWDIRTQAEKITAALRRAVGVNAPQARALTNYAVALEAAGRSPADIASLVAERRDAMIAQRARMIARNETLTAANAGQQSIWDQAVERGLLEPKQKRKWLTQGSMACEICAPMDGQIREMGEEFVSPYSGDSTEYPPIHVSCLCVTVLDL